MSNIINEMCAGNNGFEETLEALLLQADETIFKEIKGNLSHLDCLDKYDFSEFLNYGRSLFNILNAIEEKYDEEFKKEYGIYMFEDLDMDTIMLYFTSRYNVWFQEYTDWVVRREDGANSKTRKRNLLAVSPTRQNH